MTALRWMITAALLSWVLAASLLPGKPQVTAARTGVQLDHGIELAFGRLAR
jgi:hypothetical protein